MKIRNSGFIMNLVNIFCSLKILRGTSVRGFQIIFTTDLRSSKLFNVAFAIFYDLCDKPASFAFLEKEIKAMEFEKGS